MQRQRQVIEETVSVNYEVCDERDCRIRRGRGSDPKLIIERGPRSGALHCYSETLPSVDELLFLAGVSDECGVNWGSGFDTIASLFGDILWTAASQVGLSVGSVKETQGADSRKFTVVSGR